MKKLPAYHTFFGRTASPVIDLAERLIELAPVAMKRVYFVNSGSEAVETALKIALATHRLRGEPGRTRLIGRQRGYHGVCFGGLSVGGIPGNSDPFSLALPGTDHLPHTHDLEKNAFSRGQPESGGDLAQALEDLEESANGDGSIWRHGLAASVGGIWPHCEPPIAPLSAPIPGSPEGCGPAETYILTSKWWGYFMGG